jgi:hypothetical protein
MRWALVKYVRCVFMFLELPCMAYSVVGRGPAYFEEARDGPLENAD